MAKKRIALCLALAIIGSFSGCISTGDSVQSSDSSQNNDYVITRKFTPKEVYSITFEDAIGKDVMPVGTYSGPALEHEYKGKQIPSMVSKKYFDLYKEMGLNMFTASFFTDEDPAQAELFLDLCDEYNMANFINLRELYGENSAASITSEKINTAFEPYVGHKSVVGFYLRDEPNTTVIRSLSRTVRALEGSKHSDKLPYFNAHPITSTWAFTDSKEDSITYEEYLRTMIEELDAKYLSYDFYPFRADNEGNEYFNERYIENLSVAWELAKEYKIPIWTYKQAGCLSESSPLSMLIKQPNEDQFRWHITIDLAYGVKGITYFLLLGSHLGYDSQPTYEEGMDAYFGLFNGYTGEPNVWFDYAKNFKGHLQLVDEVLMNSCNEGVIAHGDIIGKNLMGDELIETGYYRELKSVEGGDSIIGCFDYKGGTALYVTNNSYTNSTAVALNFRDNYGYNIYQGTKKIFRTGEKVELNLIPGEGVLIVLE